MPSILSWNPSGSGSSPEVDVETAKVPSAGGSTGSLQPQSDSPRIKGRIGGLRMEDLLRGTVQNALAAPILEPTPHADLIRASCRARWRVRQCLRQLGGRGVLRGVEEGVAEEARTRGFAAPAFAGCAFVEGWCG